MPKRCYAEIAATKLFAGVGFDAIEAQLEWCGLLDAAPGQVLLAPGRCNDALYVVLRGRLDIHLSGLAEPCHVQVGIGDCVGEMSLIDACSPCAHVRVAAPSRLLVIERDTLWSLVDSSHALARNLLAILSGRLRLGNEALRNGMARQHEFESLAHVDSLTGLHNRRWLDQAFRRQIERAQRDTQPLSILMIDIDHFKRYNDTWGHLSGDRALRTVADALGQNLRPGDLLARYGGEEFAVLLPDTGPAQAGTIAQRLRLAVAQPRFQAEHALPLLSISLGHSQLDAGDTLERILERADGALYQAKSAGRNCVRST